jgi:hypothetical protein
MRIMKTMTLFVASALLIGVTACDVTTEPKSTVTETNVFDDTQSYEAFLAKLYAGLAVTGQRGPDNEGQPDLADFSRLDEGFTSYGRQLWQLQELPTDEAVVAWGDAGLPEMVTMGWASSNQFVQMMYSRVFFQVSLVNEFLRATTDDALAERGHLSLAEDIQGYRAEARFLRALSYWHGLDLWANIPLVTESFELGSTPPEQSDAATIYAYIVSELNDIRNELPVPGAGEYGRADQGALSMLLAKVYMNAGAYVGAADYGSTLSEVENVIGGPYALTPNYQANFMADNHNSPEIVFAIPQDGDNQKLWGGLTFLIHASVGNQMNAADYGIDGGWWGLRVLPEFVAQFPGGATSPDSRAIFFTDGQTLEVDVINDFANGYAAPKFTNITSGGAQGSHPTFPDTDLPVFRLADAYLMYAEAHLRGGGGTAAQAVTYVNALLERAYGDQSANITVGQLDLDFILGERARELWWEGHRRTDLIRFGLFTSGDYLWSWKGGQQAGQGVGDFLNLYPLPASELLANPNLTQNPGY